MSQVLLSNPEIVCRDHACIVRCTKYREPLGLRTDEVDGRVVGNGIERFAGMLVAFYRDSQSSKPRL